MTDSIFAQATVGGKKPLMQFRAGKMTKEGKLVKPDPRKGIVSLTNDPSGMVEVTWTSGNTNENVVIFPGEATVNRVKKCTTGRVIVLDLNKQRQLFFWLQEQSTERDEEILKNFKHYIGDKSKDDGSAAPSNTATAGAASSSAAASATSNNNSNIQLTQLQSILTTLGSAQGRPLDLVDLLNSDEVLSALREDPAFYMSRLHEHLPPDTDASDNIVDHVRNPQVSATAALLHAALSQPEGFREVTTAFSVNTAGQPGFGANQFVNSIIEEEKNKKEGKKSEETKKDGEQK